jgi:hypothetical protein
VLLVVITYRKAKEKIMDPDKLRKEAEDLRVKAQSARDQVESMRISADGKRQNGDDTGAIVEETQAAAIEKDVERYTNEAEAAESKAAELVVHLTDLDRQRNELETEHQRKLAEIESRKKSLTGGSMWPF